MTTAPLFALAAPQKSRRLKATLSPREGTPFCGTSATALGRLRRVLISGQATVFLKGLASITAVENAPRKAAASRGTGRGRAAATATKPIRLLTEIQSRFTSGTGSLKSGAITAPSGKRTTATASTASWAAAGLANLSAAATGGVLKPRTTTFQSRARKMAPGAPLIGHVQSAALPKGEAKVAFTGTSRAFTASGFLVES